MEHSSLPEPPRPNAPAQTTAAPVNRFIALDGMDARAALQAGLEITGVCVIGILVLLTIYYTALKLMAGLFKPAPAEGSPGDSE